MKHDAVNGEKGELVLLDEMEAEPFAEVSPLPLTREDLHHIIRALRDEAREVQQLIEGAGKTLCVEDYGDALEGAKRRQEKISRCLSQLFVRIEAEMALHRGLPVKPWADPTLGCHPQGGQAA